jgi:dihydrofolate reductase
MISIIVAINNKNVISSDGKIPWKCKEDLSLFKKLTLNKPVIMGRKTFESLNNKPLKNRTNIVLTSNPISINKKFYDNSFGPFIVTDINTSIKVASAFNNEIMIIGGESIYNQFMDSNLVDRIYISKINNNERGNKFFEIKDVSKWEEKESKQYNEFIFKIYEKRI